MDYVLFHFKVTFLPTYVVGLAVSERRRGWKKGGMEGRKDTVHKPVLKKKKKKKEKTSKKGFILMPRCQSVGHQFLQSLLSASRVH